MSDEHNDIHAALDELGAPRASTTAMRIRGLHRVLVQERDAALAALNAAEDALTECAVTDSETLSERIRELATRAAKYHGALAVATTERDNCREVLHREREERAAEKATLGAALQALRAETDTLGDTVDRLHEENERLAAQLEFAERVLISGIRRAIP